MVLRTVSPTSVRKKCWRGRREAGVFVQARGTMEPINVWHWQCLVFVYCQNCPSRGGTYRNKDKLRSHEIKIWKRQNYDRKSITLFINRDEMCAYAVGTNEEVKMRLLNAKWPATHSCGGCVILGSVPRRVSPRAGWNVTMEVLLYL